MKPAPASRRIPVIPTPHNTPLDFLYGWGVTFLALFPLANPLEAIPMFLEYSGERTPEQKAKLRLRVCVIAGIMMTGSLVLGSLLMRVAGVSPAAVLVAGGLIVAGLGFRMLITGKAGLPVEQHALEGHDAALFPLAFPGVCGPGVIAALISASSYIQGQGTSRGIVMGYAMALAGIATVCIAAWLLLLLSGRIAHRLGPAGLLSMSRFLGLLLIVIGVQLLADGVTGLVAAAGEGAPRPMIPSLGTEELTPR